MLHGCYYLTTQPVPGLERYGARGSYGAGRSTTQPSSSSTNRGGTGRGGGDTATCSTNTTHSKPSPQTLAAAAAEGAGAGAKDTVTITETVSTPQETPREREHDKTPVRKVSSEIHHRKLSTEAAAPVRKLSGQAADADAAADRKQGAAATPSRKTSTTLAAALADDGMRVLHAAAVRESL